VVAKHQGTRVTQVAAALRAARWSLAWLVLNRR